MADTQQQLHKMQGLVELPLRFELFYLNRKYAVTNLAPRVAAERWASVSLNVKKREILKED